MEVSLKEYLTEHMENKTTITIPVALRNKLYLLKKKGEAMYNVIERLLVLNEKVEKIKKRKQNLNKKLEEKENGTNKIKQRARASTN
jgi:hypothetical protein